MKYIETKWGDFILNEALPPFVDNMLSLEVTSFFGHPLIYHFSPNYDLLIKLGDCEEY